MLKERRNQCIVISGESGSGKTESTNFLLHHLTALSQKGTHGSGVEQTILSAGPVLEVPTYDTNIPEFRFHTFKVRYSRWILKSVIGVQINHQLHFNFENCSFTVIVICMIFFLLLLQNLKPSFCLV